MKSMMHHLRRELSLIQMKVISDRLINEFGCTYIALAGGEPTLHSESQAIFNYLLSYPNPKVGVITNGTTNEQFLINAYHTHPNLKIQVSLDCSCEEVNSKTRGNNSFTQAVALLAMLKCPDKSPVMKMMISKNNNQDVEAYYRLAMFMNCDSDFALINGMGNVSDNRGAFDPSAKQRFSVLRTLDHLNLEYQKQIPLPLYTHQCPLSDQEAPLSALIKCDGSIQHCQLLYNNSFSLGNILLDMTEYIVSRYEYISSIAYDRKNVVDICAKCLTRSSCELGCMALAVMNNGTPFANDGDCAFRKLQILGYEIMKKGGSND